MSETNAMHTPEGPAEHQRAFLISQIEDAVMRQRTFLENESDHPTVDFGLGLCSGEIMGYVLVGAQFGVLPFDNVQVWVKQLQGGSFDWDNWRRLLRDGGDDRDGPPT